MGLRETFREEKEQTIFFIIDVSASQISEVRAKQKWTSAWRLRRTGPCGGKGVEPARTHLLSDAREKFIKPAKGTSSLSADLLPR